MSRYALLVGLGLMFASASSKLLIRSIRERKLMNAGFDAVKAKQYIGPFNKVMNRKEASLILGVRNNASEQEILAAHKKLVMVNHPDFNGSTYIAMKINEAKDLMLLKE